MPAKALRRAADSGDVIFSFQSKTFAGLQNKYYQPADTLQAKNNILLSTISIPQTNPETANCRAIIAVTHFASTVFSQ